MKPMLDAIKRPVIAGLLLAAVILAAVGGTARADVAPPMPPPGGNVNPNGEMTQVQMLAETVLIDVKAIKKFSLDGVEPDMAYEVARANVTARFTMRNQGSQEEKLQVRFPLNSNVLVGGYEDEAFPLISGLTAKVDGKAVKTMPISGPLGPDDPMKKQDYKWAAFDVTFPPGQDVGIDVAYPLMPAGWGYVPQASFYYVLVTGAAWKGPIGSGDIILRLPYPASPQNVVFGGEGGEEKKPGTTFAGNEVRWHFDNLEPSYDDNMAFTVMFPGAWQALLDARDSVKANPNNGDRWGTLARTLKYLLRGKHVMRYDKEAKPLFDECIQAYEKAVTLSPKAARWHAGYGELLANYAEMYLVGIYYPNPPPADLLYRMGQELHAALEIDPKNQQAKDALDMVRVDFPQIVSASESGDVYHILTATLGPQPTYTPWPTQAPTDTQEPADTPPSPAQPSPSLTPAATRTATLSPAPVETRPVHTEQPAAAQESRPPAEKANPLCGGTFALALLSAGLVARRLL